MFKNPYHANGYSTSGICIIKFLFTKPLYWEVGGGAGFNINVSKHVAIVLEFGGGLHDIFSGKDLGYPKKLDMVGFGRMSMGVRYYIF